MNEIILELFHELNRHELDKIQFFDKFYLKTGIILNEEFCIAEIKNGIVEKNSETIDIFVRIGFMLGFSLKSLPIVCELLTNPSHHMHEDLAALLKVISVPSNVDCLYKAAELQFDYLDYDDTFHIWKKMY